MWQSRPIVCSYVMLPISLSACPAYTLHGCTLLVVGSMWSMLLQYLIFLPWCLKPIDRHFGFWKLPHIHNRLCVRPNKPWHFCTLMTMGISNVYVYPGEKEVWYFCWCYSMENCSYIFIIHYAISCRWRIKTCYLSHSRNMLSLNPHCFPTLQDILIIIKFLFYGKINQWVGVIYYYYYYLLLLCLLRC